MRLGKYVACACIITALAVVLVLSAGVALAQEPVGPAAEGQGPQPEQEIEKLIGELGSDNWRVRDAATKRLTEIGLPVTEAVEKLIDSEDVELRERAKMILDALHYVSKADRAKIEKEIDLCLWGTAKPVDEETRKLVADLSSDDRDVRDEAAKKLVQKGPGILKELAKLLDSDDPDLKDRVERFVKTIRENAKKKFEEQLKKSVEALKKLKSAPYYLIEVLTTRGEKRREGVISKLLAGALDNMRITRRMDGPVGVVVEVLIMQLGPKRVIMETTGLGKNPSLEKVLAAIAADERKEKDLRVRALKALEARQAARAVADLVKLLGKSGGEVQIETAKTLRKLTGQDFGPTGESTREEAGKALEEWKKWWEENKQNEKYRLSEQPDNNKSGAVIELGPANKQLEAFRKKMQRKQ